jgi:succinyl-CoA synthetase beta subunit
MMPYQARKLAYALGLGGDLLQPAVKLFLGMYRAFVDTDASLVEINPLIVTPDNQVVALEEDPREVEASKFNLNYIGLTGNIACMVNGAGLAMATMDIIKHYGGEPANFLDVGGGASTEQVTEAFKILCADKNVKAILVNIFGGIMKCDVIANGILTAVKQVNVGVPLVVRLEGTNVELGKQILKDSGLPIIAAGTMADAAQKVVEAANRS